MSASGFLLLLISAMIGCAAPQEENDRCQKPEPIKGTVLQGEWNDETYPPGKVAHFACLPDHTQDGPIKMACIEGSWFHIAKGQCKEIPRQCGPPPVIRYGDTISFNKPLYNSGESVEYKCPEYYILKGNKIVKCLSGVWDEAPVCLEPCTVKEKDLEENNIQLKWIPNKKLYSTHGDTMEFECKSGYKALTGSKMRIPCEQGKLEYPKCFKIGFCVLDQSILITNNIHYNGGSIVDNGQIITFQCNEGKIPEYNLKAKCESGGINYPKCAGPKSCKTPEILNGFFKTEPQDSYDSGSHVGFECNEDYVINGPINVKCENGEWTELPVCYSPCKISTEDLTKRNIQLLPSDNNPDIPHRHGTRFSVSCKSGFRCPNQAALVIECSDGKFRYPRCFAGETCRLEQDELDKNNLELDEVHDNEVFYEENERVHFKCKEGFHHRNKPIGTCFGQTLNYPKCTGPRDLCGQPPTIQFGYTLGIIKMAYKFGESVEYKCPVYYILIGNSVVRCLNGIWDEAPVCLEPCTTNIKDMEENNIELKWIPYRLLNVAHGDAIEFTCKSEYEAPSNTQMRIICKQGKLDYPRCFKRGYCVLDQSTMTTNNIHYNVSTAVGHQESITFQCKEGTVPENNLEVKCQWGRIRYPKCTTSRICATPEILNGFLKTEPQASYVSGSYVEVECNEDHVRNGPMYVKCEDGEWTKLLVCYSPCKISTEDLTKHNIQLLPSADPKSILGITHRHGTELRVTCKPGFRRPIQAALVIECSDGKFKYPRCFSGKTCRIDQDELDGNNLELDEVHDNKVYYEEGEIVYFKCKSGFRSRGQLTGICYIQTLSYPRCTE